MNSSENKQFAHMSRDAVMFHGSVRGAGAAAPTIPTTTFSATSSIQPMHVSNNWVSAVAGDITRSGAGVYTLKFKENIPVVLSMTTDVWGTDGKFAQITDYNATTKVLSVKTFSSVGVAADLETTDNLKITVVGMLSVPTY